MSKKLEDELQEQIDFEFRKMYEAINKKFPGTMEQLNNTQHLKIERDFVGMIKDSVRMSLWLKDDE